MKRAFLPLPRSQEHTNDIPSCPAKVSPLKPAECEYGVEMDV